VIDLFTPERCMYATNFPVDKVHTSSVEVYQRFLAWNDEWCLDAQAIDQLLYVTAAKFYKFA
jgi:predicted TIM-barrel fold metal-dependent hydrolase